MPGEAATARGTSALDDDVAGRAPTDDPADNAADNTADDRADDAANDTANDTVDDALDDEAPGRTASYRRGVGIALMLTAASSNQTGAGLGALAFPTIGPVGVVAIRQFVTAAVLLPTVRPRLRALRSRDWRLVMALALVFSVMNLALYLAIDRIGLGLAVVLEFLGPLGVAISASRRVIDFCCAATAALGVVVLVHPGASTDYLGIGMALVAAVGWASYILLNRALGRRLPGLRATACASLVTTGIWIPVAVAWFSVHVPTPGALGLAVACGVLSSAVPYSADLMALRRVPPHVFGTFTSINPVIAAMAGWALLGQTLGRAEWVGIALIVIANAVVSRPSQRFSLRGYRRRCSIDRRAGAG